MPTIESFTGCKGILMMLALAMLMSLAAGSVCAANASVKCPFKMPAVNQPVFQNKTFNIRDYGAVGDGKTSNTKAIASAIEACSKAGGGKVLIPEGIWLTGPIHLKSNINLHMDKGAEVRFSNDFNEYLPVVLTRWEGIECYNFSPLIYANGCTNIAVTGEGTLQGQGEAWWPWKANKQKIAGKLYEDAVNGVPVKDRILGKEGGLRPSFVQPINCKNVLIEGFTIKNGPMWTIHPVYCENIIVRNVKVETNGPNNDGINPDSCKNMIIEDCSFSTGDDCIVLKSGLNEDGWRVNKPTENVIIRRCHTERGHGGVVIGSEMSGGVRNVFVHDCEFIGTNIGIRMKSRRGRGGVVENIWVQDTKMKNIGDQAFQINMFYGSGTLEPRTETPPTFRNIHLKNITCEGAGQAIELIGLPEKPLENVTVENVTISGENGVNCSDVKGVSFKNANIISKASPVMQFTNGENIKIDSLKFTATTGTLIKIDGSKTKNIRLIGVTWPESIKGLELGKDVKPNEVSWSEGKTAKSSGVE